jgi:hypothetical protein
MKNMGLKKSWKRKDDGKEYYRKGLEIQPYIDLEDQ